MQETGKQPLISVILPIYNVETYLGKCLESIRGQTWENWELICVDDGSTDHTWDLTQRYAEIDRRIRVYQQKHGGVSTARNLGLSYAAGKYVLFVDGDDWLNLEMLRVLAEEAEKSRADMVVCSARILYVFRERNRKMLRRSFIICQRNMNYQNIRGVYRKGIRRHFKTWIIR